MLFRSPSSPLSLSLPTLSLTTSSAKRMLSSSAFGMGLENSMNCRGWLSRRLISGRSLPPKQHKKPRPWRLLLRGAMVTAGQGDSPQADALGPHRDLGRTERTEWSGLAARWARTWPLCHHNFFGQLSGAFDPTAKRLLSPTAANTSRFSLCALREDGRAAVTECDFQGRDGIQPTPL